MCVYVRVSVRVSLCVRSVCLFNLFQVLSYHSQKTGFRILYVLLAIDHPSIDPKYFSHPDDVKDLGSNSQKFARIKTKKVKK